MSQHSYELKRTSLVENSYQVITVKVNIESQVNWNAYPCASSSGSEYFTRIMRESLIDALHYRGQLKIAKVEHCSDMQHGYEEGMIFVGAKYYDSQMVDAGHPQAIADALYSAVMNKVNSLVTKHFEIFMANQLHEDVLKRASAKESGGDGK